MSIDIQKKDQQKIKLLAENSKSEKNLKTEIRQINLAKKIYSSTCKHEVNKLLKRFTHKIARHYFYKNKPNSLDLTQSLIDFSQKFTESTENMAYYDGQSFQFKSSRKNSDLLKRRKSSFQSTIERPKKNVTWNINEEVSKSNFVNSLQSSSRVFQEVHNRKGEPIIKGYDNYASLTNINSLSLTPFEINNLNIKNRNSLKRFQSKSELTFPKIDTIKQESDADKELQKLFKVQQVRNLTMKQLITY
jgi:hypothetical protein